MWEALSSSIIYSNDWVHALLCEPCIHFVEVNIRALMFRPGVCEEDEVWRRAFLHEADKQCGGVNASTKG